MTDVWSNAQLRTLSLSVAATAACVWLFKRQHRERQSHGARLVRIEGAPHWEESAPTGKLDGDCLHFGETGMQAQLIAERLSADVMQERAGALYNLMNTRRTMRFYSVDDVPAEVVETCIATAGTMPSGAHHQPWFFAIVKSAALKQQIRVLVEAEEKVNYDRRMRGTWVGDLSTMTGTQADKRLRTDDNQAPVKPYLTEAPIVLAMFKQSHGFDHQGNKVDNYYINESCGIAAGMLVAALHNVGLATLTSTPMGAEQKIREMLGRPDNEKLFLLMPIGYPAVDATVPHRTPLRKPSDQLYATY